MRRTLPRTSTLALALFTLPGWAQQPAAPAAASAPKTITVSSGIMAGQRIGGENPRYPAIAKAAHVSGTVVLRASISAQGAIEKLTIVSGPPMLQQAALDAVRTWIYKPYLLNGTPVQVETRVNIVFTLPEPASGGAQPNAPAGQTPQDIHTQVVQAAPQPSEAPIPPPPPANPITADQVHELMQLTGTVNLTKQMLDGMMPTLRQSMPPYMPPDVLDDFEKTLLGADFEAMLVHTYQAHLSTEDAAQIIAFYRTPAGQRMMAAMPQIARESQAAGQQLGEQVMIEVLERHKAEIEAAKEKYQTQHPWTAPNN